MKAIRPLKRILSTNVGITVGVLRCGARIGGAGIADDLVRRPHHCGFFVPEPLALRLLQLNGHIVSAPMVTME